MSAELITAISAVIVAVIAAVVSFITTRDHRKQALDEAELLTKLQASMGAEVQPVKDLESILTDRTRLWRRNRGFLPARVLLQLTGLFAALYWVAGAARRLATQEVRDATVTALEILMNGALAITAVLALLCILATIRQLTHPRLVADQPGSPPPP